MNILGVKKDNFTKQQTLQKISEFLNSQKQHKIFTPNPEMLVDAQKDEYFKKVLNSGDLNVCDGVGIVLVSWLSLRGAERRGNLNEAGDCHAPTNVGARNDRVERYSGTDLMQDICALAEKEGRSVYLLGSGSDEVVKKTAEVLKNKYPRLRIAGYSKGGKIERLKDYKIEYDKEENEQILHDIIISAPDILFVAFGHGKQEKWIYENLKHLPSVRIAMGVGGAFDYISGKIKRAPLFLRKIGLEWMYRLFVQPKRIVRIFKATVVFIYYIIFK